MINDLLRENITVFWASEDFKALSKNMEKNSKKCNKKYEQGTFIIPLSSNKSENAKTISIIYDYNYTSELEENETIQLEIYKLMTPLKVNANQLVEPKIAQHLGRPTRYGWPCYLQIIEAGGYLTMEFLLDNETASYLNNKDFNVLMWPYNPLPGTITEQLLSLINAKGCNAIRNFVYNGGGYIGSCYGALAASSGFLLPIPLFNLYRAYLPNTKSIIPFFTCSISDSLMGQEIALEKTLYITTGEITDTKHPLAYGVNKTVKEFFKGPWFVWLGKNTEQTAIYKEFTPAYSENQHNKNNSHKIIGTPSWVHSTFGDGKITLFSSHPEYVNNISVLFEQFEWEGDKYYGRRVIHNSLFYVTSKDLEKIKINIKYPVEIIEMLGEKTINLTIEDNYNSEFENIKKQITSLKSNISSFKNTTIELEKLSKSVFPNSMILEENERVLEYIPYVSDIFNGFNNNTLITLDKINKIYPMVTEFDDSATNQIENLKTELRWRIYQFEKLYVNLLTIIDDIEMILHKNRHNGFQTIWLLSVERDLLRTYEIGLKYIPQMSFESLKTLRHLWYSYEAYVAMKV